MNRRFGVWFVALGLCLQSATVRAEKTRAAAPVSPAATTPEAPAADATVPAPAPAPEESAPSESAEPTPAQRADIETPAQKADRDSMDPAVKAAAQEARVAMDTKTPDEIEAMVREFRRNKCPEICKQDEACVHGRCLRACTPECRPGTTCKPDGSCVAPPVARDLRTEDEIARIVGAKSANAREAFILDPGGILFLGVQAAYERGARHSWIGRLQLMNTGLMSYTLEPQNEFERFEFGFGTSFGYRHYETNFGNLRGFFFGGGLLGQAVQIVDDDENHFARTTYWAGTYGEFGYRWVFGNLLFGFGPNLSIRFPVGNTFTARGGDSCTLDNTCPSAGAARFEGTLTLEIGWLQ